MVLTIFKKKLNAYQQNDLRTHGRFSFFQDGIEEAGLTPIKDLLKELGGWPVLEGDSWDSETFNWWDYSAKSLGLGLSGSYISSLYVYKDSKNITYRYVTQNVMFVSLN